MPSAFIDKAPVFFPTHELLTVFPGFVSLYKNYHTGFEETWWEMCLLLGAPAVKGPREAKVKKALQPLESAMGGSVVLDANGRFSSIPQAKGTPGRAIVEGRTPAKAAGRHRLPVLFAYM
jgi:hypothetical protein